MNEMVKDAKNDIADIGWNSLYSCAGLGPRHPIDVGDIQLFSYGLSQPITTWAVPSSRQGIATLAHTNLAESVSGSRSMLCWVYLEGPLTRSIV